MHLKFEFLNKQISRCNLNLLSKNKNEYLKHENQPKEYDSEQLLVVFGFQNNREFVVYST